MIRHASFCGIAVAFLFSYSNRVMAQSPSPLKLVIDVQNAVEYQDDVGTPSQYATKAGVTPSSPPRNFFVATLLADIVAVNGQPAKGTYVGRSRSVILNPAPVSTPSLSQGIADINRAALREHVFEIQNAEGNPVGSIMSVGLSGGPAPPGAPSAEKANWTIVAR